MKKTFALFAALLCSILLIGQTNFEIKWGLPIKETKRTQLNKIIGSNGTDTYVLKNKYSVLNESVIIDRLDEHLNQIKSKELELKYEQNNLTLENILYRNKELLLFTSFMNTKQKKYYLFIQHVDNQTLETKSDIKKIAEIDYAEYSKWNSGGFYTVLSRDKSKLLVYYSLPYDENANEKFGVHVFGADNEQIWEKEITLPVPQSNYSIYDFDIDNSGNFQIIGRKQLETDSKKLKDRRYEFELLSYSNNGKTFKKYPLDLENKKITDLIISVNENNEILCGGFYSNLNYSGISGTFFLRIDMESSKVISQSLKEFNMDFITQNMTDRQKIKANKKKDKGDELTLYQYDLKDMIHTSDGGITLIGEQYYEKSVSRRVSDGNGGYYYVTDYYYYYNDIIVINISPKGEINWANKIPKHQVSMNDFGFYSSFFLMVNDDKLHFIFNDHIDNIINPEPGKTKNFTGSKNGAVAHVTFDAEGNQTRKAFFKTRDASVIIRPKVCKQIDNSKSIIYGKKKKTSQFGLIEY